MTSKHHPARLLGQCSVEDGTGVLRMQDRFDTDIDDMWSAITDPARLARWYGEVDGELRVGGEYRAVVHASGWEGTGRVEECEPPHRLVVTSHESGEPDEDVLEVTLTSEGEGTVLVLEQRGLPLDQLAGYGAGTQIHLEDLSAYLAGHGRCDAMARFGELLPAYREVGPAEG